MLIGNPDARIPQRRYRVSELLNPMLDGCAFVTIDVVNQP
jgi:hypothetical protein